MSRTAVPTVTTSEVFESYEEDLRSLIRSLQSLAAVAEGCGPSDERVAAGHEAADVHSRASQALQQMDFEVKSMGTLGVPLAGKL
ncbi:unnamed protein product, partial [Polarella glacialis]